MKIIITDTHFGVKNNSTKFLQNQLRVFDDIIKFIKDSEETYIDIIHLGDLFDSRSTVSIMVVDTVMKNLRRLYDAIQEKSLMNKMIFLAGNHDFYSQNSDSINSLDSLVKPIMSNLNCEFVTSESRIIDDCLYIPWYDAEDPEIFLNLFNKHKDEVEYIFTHTELHRVYGDLAFLKDSGAQVISGHIHTSTMYTSKETNLVNISPPYSINFGDAGDTKKGFWVIDRRGLKLVKNTKSLMFWNIHNDDIFEIGEESIKRGDNYNIYINKMNLTDERFINHIKYLSSKIQYINIIPVSDEMVESDIGIDLNIDNIIYKLIGENYKDKFTKVKQLLEETNK